MKTETINQIESWLLKNNITLYAEDMSKPLNKRKVISQKELIKKMKAGK